MLLMAFVMSASTCATPGRDICLQSPSSSQYFVFRGVRDLKPGGVMPLKGLFVDPTLPDALVALLDGSAMMTAGGVVSVGAMIETVKSTNGPIVAWTTDQTFGGKLHVEFGDGRSPSEATFSVAPVDCASIPLPERLALH